MSVLMVNDEVDFNTMKELLDATDGNLASHTHALEEAGFISVKKKFVGKKPHTSYRITSNGRKAFQQHLDALEKLIRKGK
jgi:DNA-binding PadR family transcriptional regulator